MPEKAPIWEKALRTFFILLPVVFFVGVEVTW